jgi:hypothetical protein
MNPVLDLSDHDIVDTRNTRFLVQITPYGMISEGNEGVDVGFFERAFAKK